MSEDIGWPWLLQSRRPPPRYDSRSELNAELESHTRRTAFEGAQKQSSRPSELMLLRALDSWNQSFVTTRFLLALRA